MKEFSSLPKLSKIVKQKEEVAETIPATSQEIDVTISDPIFTDFANVLFTARDKAHIFHLQTDKFSKHTALQEFYEKLLELVDELVETYQGQYGVIDEYSIVAKDDIGKDPEEYFTNLVKWISTERYDYIDKNDTHLHNIVDEIVASTYRTLYKLNNLA